MMTDITATIKELVEQEVGIFRERMHNILNEYMLPVAKGILNDTKQEYMTLIGYTPGFNDGEPCLHTLGLMEYDFEHTISEIYESPDLSDACKKQLDGKWLVGSTDYNAATDVYHIYKDNADNFLKLLESDEFVTASELALGTNWAIVYWLDDNRDIHADKIPYDPGH